MKDFLAIILTITALIFSVIGLITIQLSISASIWWGIGILVTRVFKLSFIWTFWHGFTIATILSMLRGVLKITIKKED